MRAENHHRSGQQAAPPPLLHFNPCIAKKISQSWNDTLQAWNHNDAFHNRRDKQKKLLASPLQSPTDFSDTLFSKLAWISWLCHGTVMRFMGSNYITLTKISEIWNPLSSFFPEFHLSTTSQKRTYTQTTPLPPGFSAPSNPRCSPVASWSRI